MKAITTVTVIGEVIDVKSHTAQNTGNQYMLLRVTDGEEQNGKLEFFCGSEFIQKKLASVTPGAIVCVKARAKVRVNSGTNGGEFHNVNLIGEDVELVLGGQSGATVSQPNSPSNEPF